MFALKLVRGDVTTPMSKASYGKTFAGLFKTKGSDHLRLRVWEKKVRGLSDVSHVWNYRKSRGILEGYPLLQLLKNGIGTRELRDLVDAVGGDATLTGPELYEHAWGEALQGCSFRGRVSYADACRMSSMCDNILVQSVHSFMV